MAIACSIDETLRYDPPVPVWRRGTKRPVKLGDVDLPEGAKLFLWLAASDRDDSVFPEPATFAAVFERYQSPTDSSDEA